MYRCYVLRIPRIHTQVPCTHMEAHTSCCVFARRSCWWVDRHSVGLAFRSTIFCFLHLIIASILALHPIRSCATFVQPVPTHCATACSRRHTLNLRPKHCDPSSFFKVRNHSILFIIMIRLVHAAGPLLSAAPHGRTTRSTFHHHVRFCAFPDSLCSSFDHRIMYASGVSVGCLGTYIFRLNNLSWIARR